MDNSIFLLEGLENLLQPPLIVCLSIFGGQTRKNYNIFLVLS